ncbi:MAG: glycosyltransferase family 39 protein [Terriglobales bacterium]
MGVLVHNRTLDTPATAGVNPSPYFSVRLLRAIARCIDSYPWAAFLLLTVGCGWIRIGAFATRFLDHDEIYSFYIAQAPTLKQMLFLTRTVDLHPPLSYLLIRLSFALFGPSIWACRLPFFLAFPGATAILFSFVRRLLSPLYGLIAVLFLWTIPYTHYAAEARPYSLVLCFTSLLLMSWYESAAGADSSSAGRGKALFTVTLAGFALLLSHVLGVFSIAAFAGAELIRLAIRRKPDWSLWTAFLIPGIAVVTYLPLIHSGSVILFTEKYRATPLRLFHFYWNSLAWLPIPLAFVLFLAVAWPAMRHSAPLSQSCEPERQMPPAAFRSLKYLLFFFAIVPLGIGALFARTGMAFFDRYGIVFFIPIALGPVFLLAVRTRCDQFAGALAALVLGAVLIFNTVGKIWLIEHVSLAPPSIAAQIIHLVSLPVVGLPTNPPVPSHMVAAFANAQPIQDLNTISPNLPLVANTGLTFLEMDRQADDVLTARLYLLNDTNAATEIAHDTVFENYARLKRVFPIRGRIEPFCPFIGAHPRFLVLGDYNHAQGWVLKKLDREGAELRVLGSYSEHTTEDGHLYEVTVNNATCASSVSNDKTVEKTAQSN